MNKIIKIIKEAFPNTKILLLYYSGSIAYGLYERNSDIDVTVVLDNYKGSMHINLGLVDAFIFSKESYILRQTFDKSINAYYRASADDIFSIYKTLIILDITFKDEFIKLLEMKYKTFIINHLTAVIDYNKIRMEVSSKFKSYYHLLRIRGMIENYLKTGRYELVVCEPWNGLMKEYKQNWNNSVGKQYEKLLKEQIIYLEEFKDRMILSGLE